MDTSTSSQDGEARHTEGEGQGGLRSMPAHTSPSNAIFSDDQMAHMTEALAHMVVCARGLRQEVAEMEVIMSALRPLLPRLNRLEMNCEEELQFMLRRSMVAHMEMLAQRLAELRLKHEEMERAAALGRILAAKTEAAIEELLSGADGMQRALALISECAEALVERDR